MMRQQRTFGEKITAHRIRANRFSRISKQAPLACGKAGGVGIAG